MMRVYEVQALERLQAAPRPLRTLPPFDHKRHRRQDRRRSPARLAVPPESRKPFRFATSPDTVGTHSSTIVIVSEDQTVSVSLLGERIPAPCLTFMPYRGKSAILPHDGIGGPA